MKRYIIAVILSVIIPMGLMAQSMTDEQVMKFVIKEHNAGTSQAQIVTKLMQNGVNIEQIRRVRKKYERATKDEGLGMVSGSTGSKNDTRLRSNKKKKGKSSIDADDEFDDEKTSEYNSQYRISAGNKKKNNSYVYDETNEDWMDMRDELDEFVPDTAALLNKLMADKVKRKVFGRNIFNNKKLSFEPNMNIATPQNYRLGPGDAVFIDVYGASQKTIESTVSPDGYVTIEDYGPVQVSGLTVSQANAKLRSTLGSRYSSSQIKLTVGETRSIMVNVMGEVKAPGTYTLSAFATVFHALYMAGGTNDLGTLRNIKVYRNNRLVSVVDI